MSITGAEDVLFGSPAMDHNVHQEPGCGITTKVQDQETAIVVQDWINRFGVSLKIHSDYGRKFDSTLLQESKILDVKKTRTIQLHPQ